MRAGEKLQLEWNNGFYDSDVPATDLQLKREYNRRLRDVLEGTDNYWLAKPLRTGITHRHNLRLDGGSQEFRWGASIATSNISGVMKNNYRNNFNGAITLQYNYKNIIFRNQTNILVNKGRQSNYGAFSQYTRMNPYHKIYDEDGQLIRLFNNQSGIPEIANPLYNATLGSFDESGYTQMGNNFSIDWTIVKGLMLRGRFGISTQNSSTHRFISPLNSIFLTPEFQTGARINERGEYVFIPGEANSYDASATLSYTNIFRNKHQIYSGVDISMLERKSSSYTFIMTGFTNDDLSAIGNAMMYKPTPGRPSGTDNFTRSVGFTGNVNYTFDNRYFADLSLRVEGSSQFGNNNRFAPFYSIGTGWNLHREDFLKDYKFINNLRLKASYGQTGSQQFSAFQAMRVFEYHTNDRYATWGSAYLSRLGNDELKWQITDQYNIGFELGLWNNRITAEFDIYEKKTSNLLSDIQIPTSTGFGNYIANIGEVKNNGFEASLGGAIIRNVRRDLLWSVTGKFAYNKDVITKLSEDVKRQTQEYLESGADVATLFYEGHSQNSIYVVRSLGIDPSTGQEVFLDRHGNTVYNWNAGDKVYAGVLDPMYRGNISSLFRYKNISINVSFGYHWGGVAYNQTLIDRVEVTRTNIINNNVDRRVLTDRWNAPGDVAGFRRITPRGESDVATRATSRFVMDDRVFQMQTASIEYRLNQPWLRKAGIQSARIGVNMSDLFYISSIKRERGLNSPFARRVGASLTLML